MTLTNCKRLIGTGCFVSLIYSCLTVAAKLAFLRTVLGYKSLQWGKEGYLLSNVVARVLNALKEH